MPNYSEPPMDLGETLQGTDDDGNLINSDKLGMIYTFPTPPSSTALPRACGRPIKAILLRNTSGTTLYGKRLGQLDVATGNGQVYANTVAGYTVAATATKVVIIDSYLGTTGIADDDIFWGILEGPCVGQMQTLASAASVVVAGAFLVAGSGAGTATNTTSGGLGMTTAPVVQNIVGVAVTGRTTADTGSDVALNACIQVF